MTSPAQPFTEAGRRYFAGTASDMTFRYGPGWTLLDVIRDIEDEAAMLEARGMQTLIGLGDPKIPWKTVLAAAEMVRRTLLKEDRRMLRQILDSLPRSVCTYDGIDEPRTNDEKADALVSLRDVAAVLNWDATLDWAPPEVPRLLGSCSKYCDHGPERPDGRHVAQLPVR